MPIRTSSLALAALLLVAPVAHGQQAPTISGPAGTYTSTVVLPTPGPVPLTGTWSGPAGEYTLALPAGSTVTTLGNTITITLPTVAAPVTVVAAPVVSVVPAPVPAPPVASVPAPVVHPAPVAIPLPMPTAQVAVQSPTPAPAPSLPLWVALVTDKSSKTPLTLAQLALATSPTIAASLKAINPANQWTGSLDVASPTGAAWAPWATAKGIAPPYVLVLEMGPNGRMSRVEVIGSPKDEAGVVGEVARVSSGGVPAK